MAELVDALVLGTSEQSWGFESLIGHQQRQQLRAGAFMSQLPSRTPDIDIDECADKVGGKTQLILIAAKRARDLRNKHIRSSKEVHMNFATEAMLDIQNGVIDKDYLSKSEE